jgi:hypothetical protein
LKIVVVGVPMFMFVSQDDYEKIVNGRVLLEDIMALSDVIKRYFRLESNFDVAVVTTLLYPAYQLLGDPRKAEDIAYGIVSFGLALHEEVVKHGVKTIYMTQSGGVEGLKEHFEKLGIPLPRWKPHTGLRIRMVRMDSGEEVDAGVPSKFIADIAVMFIGGRTRAKERRILKWIEDVVKSFTESEKAFEELGMAIKKAYRMGEYSLVLPMPPIPFIDGRQFAEDLTNMVESVLGPSENP